MHYLKGTSVKDTEYSSGYFCGGSALLHVDVGRSDLRSGGRRSSQEQPAAEQTSGPGTESASWGTQREKRTLSAGW